MLLSPIVGVADTSPEGGSKKCVILSAAKYPTEKVSRTYSVDLHPPGSLLRYARKDSQISYVIARHKVPRQSLGVKHGVYTAYFFRGIATLTAIRHLTLMR